MKKLMLSALCGLCLLAAFACASNSTDTNTQVALSRRGGVVRM